MIAAADANRHDLSSLRQYLVGAAPVPASLIERCQAQGLAVYHCYGSSEHPTVTSGVVDDPLDKQLHTEGRAIAGRSEEHTSELQSLMRTSYAVFCLTKKNKLQTE